MIVITGISSGAITASIETGTATTAIWIVAIMAVIEIIATWIEVVTETTTCAVTEASAVAARCEEMNRVAEAVSRAAEAICVVPSRAAVAAICGLRAVGAE